MSQSPIHNAANELHDVPHVPLWPVSPASLQRPGTPTRWIRQLGAYLIRPTGLLARVRWLFLLAGLIAALLLAILLLLESTPHWGVRLLGGITLGVLVRQWMQGYRQAMFPRISILVEALCLLIIGIAAGNPQRVAGLVFFGLYFRALYGSIPGMIISLGAYFAAYLGATAFMTTQAGAAGPWDQMLAQAIGLVQMTGVMHFLARTVRKYEQTTDREQILRVATSALGATLERTVVYRVAIDAARNLMGGGEQVTAWVAIGSVEQMRVAACSHESIEQPAEVPLSLHHWSPATRSTLLDGRQVWSRDQSLAPDSVLVATPLMIRAELFGLLLVNSPTSPAEDSKMALQRLALQVALTLERIALTEDLQQSEARFRSLVQNSSDVMTIVETDGTIRYQTGSIEHMFGHQFTPSIGANVTDCVHPDDVPQALGLLRNTAHQAGVSSPVEWRVRQADGTWRPVETVGNNLRHDPDVGGIVLNTRDISDRKRLEEKLFHQAFHDSLTRLPNRALFMNRLEHALARTQRTGETIAVLFLDLDRFKVINDSLGHDVGDQLLIGVTSRLETCVRPGDTVARLGGDEFTVLLEHIADVSVAEHVAERIAEQLQAPFVLAGNEVCISTSVGIALSSAELVRPDEVLRCADVAMYEAKSRGKACYAVFDASLNERAWRRLELEIELRRGIKEGELRVYYQPLISLESGQIVEVEALVRWEHPRRGLLGPDEFIPLAEETGLILPLGQWVLLEASRQVREWQRRIPGMETLLLSVNLSARQFQDLELVDQVAAIVAETGLSSGTLRLEITESVAMSDGEATIAMLRALKQLGVQLAIDDFGTGYSSINYLKRFSIDILKIDRSFVQGLGRDAEDTAMVQAVIAFAKTLSLTITAEGIETTEQLTHLRALGCDFGQGYLFAPPLDSDAFQTLFEAEPHW